MKLRLTASVIMLSLCVSAAFAEGNAVADSATIVSHINQPQSTVRVIMPELMQARLRHVVAENIASESDEDDAAADSRISSAHRVKAGYRIQVFDDNNVRTAKQEARNRQHQIEMRFPEFKTYVSFNSPYWRVKVGDFRSRGEAESAMAEIKHAFPALARQIRIVRDRININ